MITANMANGHTHFASNAESLAHETLLSDSLILKLVGNGNEFDGDPILGAASHHSTEAADDSKDGSVFAVR